MPYLVGHFDRCTGCVICALACSGREHGGYNPRIANLEVRMSPEGLVHFPVVCHQCERAPCMKSCEVDAITRNDDTGAVVVDAELCIGCGDCEEACPLGMIKMVDKTAHKCDLCGGDPLCIKECPAGALSLVKGEEG